MPKRMLQAVDKKSKAKLFLKENGTLHEQR